MEKFNEYSIYSGGYIFDLLDKKAHDKAKEILGDCVTASSSIHFLHPIIDDNFEIITKVDFIASKKVILNISIPDKVYATFIFAKYLKE